MGQRGSITALLRGLGRAHLLLSLVSLLCAVALIIAEVLRPNAVGGPVGIFLAVLFVLNAVARLWMRGRRRDPTGELPY